MSARPRILELDGLRTLAVFAVMMHHYFPRFHTQMAWAGVDLFFVLSGFLITGILIDLRSDPTPYRKFYWRRIIRIFPPYYAVLAIIAVLAFAQHDLGKRSQWITCLFFFPTLWLGLSLHLQYRRLRGPSRF
jgi:peptidoglycan/LPS O-acetylase OafA/YrhL